MRVKESCDKSVVDDTDHLQPLDKRQRTSSVVEEHFQASALPTEAAPPTAGDLSPRPGRAAHAGPQQWPSCLGSVLCPRGALVTFHSPPGASLHPGATPAALLPLDGEARPAPTVKEKYPVLKDLMDFIKDQSLSHER